ncbi:MAG: two-component regulator propeller domain-containing protein [Acidobacteriota bacterium]|nr:ATP-binding protein [Blastocatellia bacterium]MDW8411265.1 two-component regulator propeller domain-containing protein [Acidobacteriota bacterium]
MRCRFTIVLIALTLLSAVAYGQIYNFKVYSANTGLPNNSIYIIFQDSKGYIWFGTDAGACRYDGKDFATYGTKQGLPDNSVRAIFEDAQHNIWIATKGGLSRKDANRWTNLTTADGLLHNDVRCGLPSRKGGLWIGTNKGLSYFDGKSFRNYSVDDGLPDAPIWHLLEDKSGLLWIATRGGGLVSFDGKKFTRYEDKTNKNTFQLALDSSGALWIATDDGLVRYSSNNFTYYRKTEGLGSNRVSSIAVDDFGRIWCGTFGGGIARLEEGKFKVFNRKNGLPDNYVTSLLKDFEGNVWIGTLWSGACRFRNEQFSNYTKELGLVEGLISGISESANGEIWVSSVNDGIARIDVRGQIYRYTEGPLQEGAWTIFADSKNRVWIGNQTGVSCYYQGRFVHYPLKQIGLQERITSITEDGSGNLWFASNSSRTNGIACYDGKSFKVYSTAAGLASNQASMLRLDSKKRLWICTEKGLSVFDGFKFTTYTTADGLPTQRVLCFTEDQKGRYWIGTTEGLTLFDGNSFKTYTETDGLINNFVSALVATKDTLWIGTSKGISAYDGISFRNYTTKDGLVNHDVYIGAALARADGTVWFGTTGGIVCYDPKFIPPQTKVKPKIALEAVEIESSGQTFTNIEYAELQLAHKENSLRFRFAGLSFVDEDTVEYSYNLQGYDGKWVDTKEREVRFTNLSPGRYTFSVKAKSSLGLWSDPVYVRLTIAAPFWQRWWFIVISLATLIVVLYLLFRWRLSRLALAQERRIKEMSELFESVSLINSKLDLQTVLQNIAEEGARLIGGETGGIGLVEGDKLVFNRTWTGKEWTYRKIEFPLGQGIAGLVAQTGQTIIVNDTSKEPRLLHKNLVKDYNICGFINVPIISRDGKVVGVIDVRRKANRPPFTAVDQQLLEALAHQAAVAIENAELYTALAEKSSRLEQLYKNEQQVSKALQELNQMKSNFLAVTSHEMRTPLTVLKGYHEMLLEGYLGELLPKQKSSIQKCYQTIERMIANLNDILEMLKIEEQKPQLQPEPADFRETLLSVLQELQPFIDKRHHDVQIILPAKLPAMVYDRSKIYLVLLNLLQNAIKFTPDGGKISVEAIVESDNKIRIIISDNGVGIDSSELEKIFDKFYTSSNSLLHTSGKYEFMARGTGLGLAIVKSYIEAHGGTVWAESEGSGKGSKFTVLLPCNTTLKQKAMEVVI